MRNLGLALLCLLAATGCGRSRTFSFGDPRLTLEPLEANLGAVLPGQSVTYALTLSNPGRVKVTQIQGQSLGLGQFVVEALPTELEPGQSAPLRVRYTGQLPPRIERTRLRVTSNAPPVTATLQAQTLDPCSSENCGPSSDPCFFDGHCVAGVCSRTPKVNAACDDGDACTVQDQCDGQGKCAGARLGCDLPPPTKCLDSMTLANWGPGRCQAGACSYQPTLTPCLFGCVNAACVDPCAGVVCNQPPSPCHQQRGTCRPQLPVGVCSYALEDGKACVDGDPCTVNDTCLNAVCQGTPMGCATPPPPRCVDADNSEVYDPTGVCKAGTCEYTHHVDFCAIACMRTRCMSSCSVSVAAGTGQPGSQDGAALGASFSNPYGLVLDASGTVFINDTSNQRIRSLTATGIVATIPGSLGISGPHDVTLDGAGGLIIGARGQVYWLSSGNLTVLAGTGVANPMGTSPLDGPALSATFGEETSVVAFSPTDVYITDGQNNRIRHFLNGQVTTIAGVGFPGLVNGPNLSAAFNYPHELVIFNGDLVVADAANHAIRRVGIANPVTSTFAGSGTQGAVNGPPLTSRFNEPLDLGYDAEGAFYLVDTYNHCVRRVSPTRVTTFAGICAANGGYVEGPAALARFRAPAGIAVAPNGTIFIADTDNNRIRRIDCVP